MSKIYYIEKEHPYNCWGAKITGVGGRYGLVREFVSQKSFSSSGSKRNYYDFYIDLEPNSIYEISVGKYAKENRYFLKTDSECNIEEISKDEVFKYFGETKKQKYIVEKTYSCDKFDSFEVCHSDGRPLALVRGYVDYSGQGEDQVRYYIGFEVREKMTKKSNEEIEELAKELVLSKK